MTKANEIINTIGELTKYYGKKISTYWLPWIPTILLVVFYSFMAATMIEDIGQVDEIETTWVHPFLAIALFILPWMAGHLIGEIPTRKKKDEDA